MKVGPFEFSYNRKEEISSNNLYVALIGTIDAEFISKDEYINRGEHPERYTVVRKLKNTDTYLDVFGDIGYAFRDETSSHTILKMYACVPTKDTITLEYLKEVLQAYDIILKKEKETLADNKVYVRTRKID